MFFGGATTVNFIGYPISFLSVIFPSFYLKKVKYNYGDLLTIFSAFHVTENLTKSCDLNHVRVVLLVKKQVGLKRHF